MKWKLMILLGVCSDYEWGVSQFFSLVFFASAAAALYLHAAQALEDRGYSAVLQQTFRAFENQLRGVMYQSLFAGLHPCRIAVSHDWQSQRDADYSDREAESGSASVAAEVLLVFWVQCQIVSLFFCASFSFLIKYLFILATLLHVNTETMCWSASFKSWQRCGGIMWPVSQQD